SIPTGSTAEVTFSSAKPLRYWNCSYTIPSGLDQWRSRDGQLTDEPFIPADRVGSVWAHGSHTSDPDSTAIARSTPRSRQLRRPLKFPGVGHWVLWQPIN